MKTMIVLLLCSVLTSVSFAEETKVEITSFNYAGNRTRAAELCGKVTGITLPIVAKVTVDPKSDKSGIYNALVSDDGRFCLTVVTYTGEADVSLWKLEGDKITSRVPTVYIQGKER